MYFIFCIFIFAYFLYAKNCGTQWFGFTVDTTRQSYAYRNNMSSPIDTNAALAFTQKKTQQFLAWFLLHCSCDLQLPIVASSMVSLYFLELTDVLQPALVGFRCHDRLLSMPYVESGEELIPLLMLLSLAFAGPAASVSALHSYRNHKKKQFEMHLVDLLFHN